MPTLGAYILVHNEEDLLKGCIDLILPYVDELLLINHESTDNSENIIKSYEHINKIRTKFIPYKEPIDMGEVRTACYGVMESDWVIAVDCDEYYPPESMQKIKEFIENPGEAISARVKYHNLAWRAGFKQKDFGHYPDRIYLRNVIDRCEGVLPLDMQYVKKEHLLAPNKTKGAIGVLEYDNDDDVSFEHPRQPILDVYYYHLARTRGYNFEYNKNKKYQRFMHPEWTEEECEKNARINQWTTGLYDIEPISVPKYVPTQTIPNPKVSIIITNYNYGQWVGKAIESALNQTVKPNSVIVVDDCSTDNSREIIERYDVKKLYQSQNKGVVQCRNWAMSECTGDFFILLDADDYIAPDYIKKTLAKQKETKAQIVYTDMHIFNMVEHDHIYPDFSVELLKQAQILPSVCALYDRHVFELNGGFREDTVYDDYEWHLRNAIKHGFDFAQVHEPLFFYNRKLGSRVEELDKRQAEGFAQLNREYGKYI